MLKRPLLWRRLIACHNWSTIGNTSSILLSRAGSKVARAPQPILTLLTYKYTAVFRWTRPISSRGLLLAAITFSKKTYLKRTASCTKMNAELTQDWGRKDWPWALNYVTMTIANTHRKTIKWTVKRRAPWQGMFGPGLEQQMTNLTSPLTKVWPATSRSHWRRQARVRLKLLPLRKEWKEMQPLRRRPNDPSSTTLTWSRRNRMARVVCELIKN